MKSRLLIHLVVSGFVGTHILAMKQNSYQVKMKPYLSEQAQEQYSVLFNPENLKTINVWHYSEEQTPMKAILDQVCEIVQRNTSDQDNYQETSKRYTKELEDLSTDINSDKTELRQGPSDNKKMLSDSFSLIAVYSQIIKLQDSRIKCLMENNKKLHALLEAQEVVGVKNKV